MKPEHFFKDNKWGKKSALHGFSYTVKTVEYS